MEDYLMASEELYEKRLSSAVQASKKEIMLLLHLARLINDEQRQLDGKDKAALCKRIILPSTKRQLLHVEDLTYDDMPWVSKKGPTSQSVATYIKIFHGNWL